MFLHLTCIVGVSVFGMAVKEGMEKNVDLVGDQLEPNQVQH
jgi:hypothetical protein